MLEAGIQPNRTQVFHPIQFKSFVEEIRPNVVRLSEEDRIETLEFLCQPSVHSVVMSSFINDNGMVSPLNRGRFFGYRNGSSELSGIALIGHSTLVDARSREAVRALAMAARSSKVPIHMIMSSGQDAIKFFDHYCDGLLIPRMTCTELLFEATIPLADSGNRFEPRPASLSQIEPIARVQAELAAIESGIDPLAADRTGFLERVQRRIEKGRTFVVFENGSLLFKADIIAETSDVIYLEGIYVAPDSRGNGIGAVCMSNLCNRLLEKTQSVCLLSNEGFLGAHRCYARSGMQMTGSCTTVFL